MDTSTTEIYTYLHTLTLLDACPISRRLPPPQEGRARLHADRTDGRHLHHRPAGDGGDDQRPAEPGPRDGDQGEGRYFDARHCARTISARQSGLSGLHRRAERARHRADSDAPHDRKTEAWGKRVTAQ